MHLDVAYREYTFDTHYLPNSVDLLHLQQFFWIEKYCMLILISRKEFIMKKKTLNCLPCWYDQSFRSLVERLCKSS